MFPEKFAVRCQRSQDSLRALQINIASLRVHGGRRCGVAEINGVAQEIIVALFPKQLSGFGIKTGNALLQIRTFAAKVNDLYAPSVDRLLTSASESCGERLVAIILTGMGDDGAHAMRLVRERGGRTIAESPRTAIIFGMPNEAIKTGCVDQVLPLGEIPGAIQTLCRG